MASENDGEAVYWRFAWDELSPEGSGCCPGEAVSGERPTPPEFGVVLPSPERRVDERLRV